jgi:hypothetical protein
MSRRRTVSDTVTVTADGRTVVDITKLFAKKHIQDMIREMRAKTIVVPPRRQFQESPKHHSAAD